MCRSGKGTGDPLFLSPTHRVDDVATHRLFGDKVGHYLAYIAEVGTFGYAAYSSYMDTGVSYYPVAIAVVSPLMGLMHHYYAEWSIRRRRAAHVYAYTLLQCLMMVLLVWFGSMGYCEIKQVRGNEPRSAQPRVPAQPRLLSSVSDCSRVSNDHSTRPLTCPHCSARAGHGVH
jgi:hypothetical protein